MNKTTGFISSIINVISVFLFALFMPFLFNFGSYLASMFIAFSYLILVSSFVSETKEERKATSYTALGFACVYVTLIILVYMTQLTVVRFGNLTEAQLQILDYQRMGLFFVLDLLGYGIMALSTFFLGLSIQAKEKKDKWLKGLLIGHGIFFPCCLFIPMLNLFQEGQNPWIGISLLEFWCVFFLCIGVLCAFHFREKQKGTKTL